MAPDGRLFVTDTDMNEILTVSTTGDLKVFLKPAGVKDGSFHGKEPGTNGNAFDSSGTWLNVAGHALRQVFRFDKLEGSSSVTVLADRYQGSDSIVPTTLCIRKMVPCSSPIRPMVWRRRRKVTRRKSFCFRVCICFEGQRRGPRVRHPLNRCC